jgi:hypothetical protein
MAGSEEQEGQVERLAKEAEQETRSLEKGADELGERIDETRGDWMRKRRDKSVPGAPPPDEDEPEDSGAEDGDDSPD